MALEEELVRFICSQYAELEWAVIHFLPLLHFFSPIVVSAYFYLILKVALYTIEKCNGFFFSLRFFLFVIKIISMSFLGWEHNWRHLGLLQALCSGYSGHPL